MKKVFWALVDKETDEIVFFWADCEVNPTPSMAIFNSRTDARNQKEDWQKVVKISINYED